MIFDVAGSQNQKINSDDRHSWSPFKETPNSRHPTPVGKLGGPVGKLRGPVGKLSGPVVEM